MTIINIDHKLCKGCNSWAAKDGCFIKHERRQDVCPCIKCLVKPMCSAGCKERSEIRTVLITLKKEKVMKTEGYLDDTL